MISESISRKTAALIAAATFVLSATSVEAVDTYFADQTDTFTQPNDYWYQQFTVNSTTRFVLRFTSEYLADAAVVTSGQINSFINNNSFTGYAVFDNKFGTQSVTLAAGTYYLCARNQSSGANAYRMELDYDIQVPNTATQTYSYAGIVMNGTEYVDSNGGKLWHGFTIESGYRYFIDGCNPGMDVFIIPAASLSVFQSGGTFQYYTDYSGFNDAQLPGLSELNLGPGAYYLAVVNKNGVDRPVTYTLERWKIQAPPSGSVEMTGASSWATSGNQVEIKVAKVSNKASGRSGSLRLRLWAVKKRYSGGRISGYIIGTRSLKPLSAGYAYTNISGKVPYKRPPSGRYYTALTLEEYTSSGWVSRDWVSFSGTSKF